MNPRAATNDLLPFQGSPFGQLGYFSKMPICLRNSQKFLKRRGWDSNPRALSDKRFSRPPRYDHFDTSPYLIFRPHPHATWTILPHIGKHCQDFIFKNSSCSAAVQPRAFYPSVLLRKTSAISRSSGVVILIFSYDPRKS